MSNNVIWHSHPVDRKTRAEQKLQELLYLSGVLKAGYAPISISA